MEIIFTISCCLTHPMLQVLQVNFSKGCPGGHSSESEVHVLHLLGRDAGFLPTNLLLGDLEGLLHFWQLVEEVLVLFYFLTQIIGHLEKKRTTFYIDLLDLCNKSTFSGKSTASDEIV